jgi:hypothetical protein
MTPGFFSWKNRWLRIACLTTRLTFMTLNPEDLAMASKVVDSPTANDLSRLKRRMMRMLT